MVDNLSNNRRRMTRKRNIDRRTAPGGSEGPALSVFTNQRLIPPIQQRSSVPQFLDRLGKFVERKNREKVDEAVDTAMATGEIPEDMKDNVLFQNSMALRRGKRMAVEKLASLEATVEREVALAAERGEEVDPAELTRQHFADLMDGPEAQNEYYRKQLERGVEAGTQFAAQKAAQQMARAAVEQSKDDHIGMIEARIEDAGAPVTPELLQGMSRDENPDDPAFGLTRNEITDNVVAAVTGRAARADNPEQLEQLKFSLETWLEGHDRAALVRNRDELERVFRVAGSRIAAGQSAASAADSRLRGDTRVRLNGMILRNPGEPETLQAINEARGVLTEAQYVSLMKQNDTATFERERAAREEAAQASLFASVDASPAATFPTMSPEEQRAYTDRTEEEFLDVGRQMVRRFSAALQAGDPDQLQAELSAMNDEGGELDALDPLVERAEAMNYTPRALRGIFNVSDPDSGNLPAAAATYDLMVNRYGIKSPIFGDVDDQALANMTQYLRLTRDGGLSPEDALARMRDRAARMETDADLWAGVVSSAGGRADMNDLLEDAVDELGEFGNKAAVQRKLKDLSVFGFRTMGDAEEAVKWARDLLSSTHKPMNGQLVPIRGMNAVFTAAWGKDDRFTALFDKQLAAAGYGDLSFDDIVPLPVSSTRTTGLTYMVNKKTGDFLRDENGPIQMDTHRIANLFLEQQGVTDAEWRAEQEAAADKRRRPRPGFGLTEGIPR